MKFPSPWRVALKEKEESWNRETLYDDPLPVAVCCKVTWFRPFLALFSLIFSWLCVYYTLEWCLNVFKRELLMKRRSNEHGVAVIFEWNSGAMRRSGEAMTELDVRTYTEKIKWLGHFWYFPTMQPRWRSMQATMMSSYHPSTCCVQYTQVIDTPN